MDNSNICVRTMTLTGIRETERPWKGRTQTGYGKAVPTRYMVQGLNKRWYRVKCSIFSNSGVTYITSNGVDFIFDDEHKNDLLSGAHTTVSKWR